MVSGYTDHFRGLLTNPQSTLASLKHSSLKSAFIHFFLVWGLFAIILWRVKQQYSDIIALVAMSIGTAIFLIIPVYISIAPAVSIPIASWRLVADKESMVMC
jgi:hypothetical protein